MYSPRIFLLLAALSTVIAPLEHAAANDSADPAPPPARGTTKVPPASPRRPAGMSEDHSGHEHAGNYYPEDQLLGDVFAEEHPDFCNGCRTCCGTLCQPGGCGMFVRAEYLLWSTKGMRVPALVTTGDPTSTVIPAGVINEDGSLPANTTVLFGNGLINGEGHSGGRIVFGAYINPCWTLEGEYLGLRDETTAFRGVSTGDIFLGIPFFDESNDGLPAIFIIAPGAGGPDGSVSIDATTRYQGAGFRLLRSLCCSEGCGPAWWDGCPIDVAKRIDFLIGYRFNRLDDVLIIDQTHDIQGTIRTGQDVFDTENQFHGLDLGTMLQFRRGCWSLDLITKVGIGNTRSVVLINGTAFQNGVQQTPAGGILAVSSNSGQHENNAFTMLPEVGLNVGYQLNPCWRFTCGYNLMYWCGVYRAGDQIDQHINPNLWPPLPIQGNSAGLWPQFPGRGAEFWAQGVNFGLEAKW